MVVCCIVPQHCNWLSLFVVRPVCCCEVLCSLSAYLCPLILHVGFIVLCNHLLLQWSTDVRNLLTFCTNPASDCKILCSCSRCKGPLKWCYNFFTEKRPCVTAAMWFAMMQRYQVTWTPELASWLSAASLSAWVVCMQPVKTTSLSVSNRCMTVTSRVSYQCLFVLWNAARCFGC